MYTSFNTQFKNHFSRDPIMVYRAPGRMNIIGEHTDYNEGLCLPAAIQQSVYFGLIPSNETSIYSLDQKNSWCPGTVSKMPDWAVYFNGVLELLKQKGYNWPYFKLAFGGDLPIGAGLSSSSAITCGFVAILDEFSSWNLSMDQLTKFAVQGEKASGLNGGMMDQICIFNGKKDHALLIDCSHWGFSYVPAVFDNYTWLVADTGVKHRLVDSDYNNRSAACKQINQIIKQLFQGTQSISQLNSDQFRQLNSKLNPAQRSMTEYVLEENQRVQKMVKALNAKNFQQAGLLLLEGHEGLRKKYRVSCPELDFMVNYAKNSNLAIGARMMGGGFGGCSLHLLPTGNLTEYTNGLRNAYKHRFGSETFCFEAIIDDGLGRID